MGTAERLGVTVDGIGRWLTGRDSGRSGQGRWLTAACGVTVDGVGVAGGLLSVTVD
jgi:hypothetical protein